MRVDPVCQKSKKFSPWDCLQKWYAHCLTPSVKYPAYKQWELYNLNLRGGGGKQPYVIWFLTKFTWFINPAPKAKGAAAKRAQAKRVQAKRATGPATATRPSDETPDIVLHLGTPRQTGAPPPPDIVLDLRGKLTGGKGKSNDGASRTLGRHP
jgi:hypothetical protein